MDATKINLYQNEHMMDTVWLHGFLWLWVIGVCWWCDKSCRMKCLELYYQPRFRQMQQSWLDGSSQYRWTKIQNPEQRQELLKEKNWNMVHWLITWSQPNWSCFSFAEGKTKGRKSHKEQLKTAVPRGWQCITKEKFQSFVMFMVSIIQAVIAG